MAATADPSSPPAPMDTGTSEEACDAVLAVQALVAALPSVETEVCLDRLVAFPEPPQPALTAFAPLGLRLSILSLQGCGLVSLHGLPEMPALRHLLLQDNHLDGTSLHVLPQQAPALCTLMLDNNGIAHRRVLAPLNRLHRLQHLSLRNNRVTRTPDYGRIVRSMIHAVQRLDESYPLPSSGGGGGDAGAVAVVGEARRRPRSQCDTNGKRGQKRLMRRDTTDTDLLNDSTLSSSGDSDSTIVLSPVSSNVSLSASSSSSSASTSLSGLSSLSSVAGNHLRTSLVRKRRRRNPRRSPSPPMPRRPSAPASTVSSSLGPSHALRALVASGKAEMDGSNTGARSSASASSLTITNATVRTVVDGAVVHYSRETSAVLTVSPEGGAITGAAMPSTERGGDDSGGTHRDGAVMDDSDAVTVDEATTSEDEDYVPGDVGGDESTIECDDDDEDEEEEEDEEVDDDEEEEEENHVEVDIVGVNCVDDPNERVSIDTHAPSCGAVRGKGIAASLTCSAPPRVDDDDAVRVEVGSKRMPSRPLPGRPSGGGGGGSARKKRME